MFGDGGNFDDWCGIGLTGAVSEANEMLHVTDGMIYDMRGCE